MPKQKRFMLTNKIIRYVGILQYAEDEEFVRGRGSNVDRHVTGYVTNYLIDTDILTFLRI